MAFYQNFNYLDHLEEIEIDVTSYLSLFSDSNYTLKFSNFQSVKTNVKNIFSRLDLLEGYKDKSGAFFKYYIQETELPEDLALKFYGSEDFWWVVTIYNSIKNPFIQWPMTNDQMDYVAELYSLKQDKYSKEGYKALLAEKSLERQYIDVLNPALLREIIFAFQQAIFTVNDDNTAFEIVVR